MNSPDCKKMKSFLSKSVFKDVVDGPGWTDEYIEKLSQKHLIENNLFNNSSIKDNKTEPKV